MIIGSLHYWGLGEIWGYDGNNVRERNLATEHALNNDM